MSLQFVLLVQTVPSGKMIQLLFVFENVFKMNILRVFKYSLCTNKLYLTNKFSYTNCLLCIKHIAYNNQSFLFSFGTRGRLLLWNLSALADTDNDDSVKPNAIEGLHQSGINAIDMFYDLQASSLVRIATVGDDTRLSVLTIDLNKDFINEEKLLAKKDCAHASAIVGNV